MEANGAVWMLLKDRQEAQGRRLDTVEDAVRSSAARTIQHEETTANRLANVERELASIKTTLKVVGGVIGILSPFLTAILLVVIR